MGLGPESPPPECSGYPGTDPSSWLSVNRPSANNSHPCKIIPRQHLSRFEVRLCNKHPVVSLQLLHCRPDTFFIRKHSINRRSASGELRRFSPKIVQRFLDCCNGGVSPENQ